MSALTCLICCWYSQCSHREAILRGEEDLDEGGGFKRPESEVNLWPYFQANAFTGFGDGAKVLRPLWPATVVLRQRVSEAFR